MREELLKKEMEELHSYVRSHFQLLVGWFTFFCTVAVGAIAWGVSASLDDKHKLVTSLPALAVCLFYTVQILLGCVTCWLVHRDLRSIRRRITDIQSDLSGQRSGDPLQPRSALTRALEHTTILMIVALVSLLPFFWWVYVVVTKIPRASP